MAIFSKAARCQFADDNSTGKAGGKAAGIFAISTESSKRLSFFEVVKFLDYEITLRSLAL